MNRNPYQRVRTGKGRRENITISGCSSDEDVAERRAVIRHAADELVAAGRHDKVKDLCAQLGAAATPKLVALIRRSIKELIAREAASPDEVTVRQLGEDWTSGRLHKRFPDYVIAKATSKDDVARLRLYIYPLVENVPLVKFTLENGQAIMRALPDWMSSATRRHVAQVLYKLLRYAVYPCKYIPYSPLPVGFLPKIGSPKAKQYLYPDEDALLMGCETVPIEYRLAYGILDREGLRPGELIGNAKEKTPAIEWSDFDLKRGMILLDKNKTNDPRAWALQPDVVAALRIWQERSPAAPFPGVDPNHFARRFREHLAEAKVERRELTAPATTARRPIRGHDLRATFITISLANGKSEAWIQDRTGHTSSEMINRYRRLARSFAELNLGTLRPLDALVPEFAQAQGKSAGVGEHGQMVGKSSEEKGQKVA